MEYFWVRKFLLLLRVRPSFVGGVMKLYTISGIFGVIPLSLVKLPSLRFLGFVIGALSNLLRGIYFVFQGSCCLHHLKILKLIPFYCLFAFRMTGGGGVGRGGGSGRDFYQSDFCS